MKSAKHVTRLSGYNYSLGPISFWQATAKVHDDLIELIGLGGGWHSKSVCDFCNRPTRRDELLNVLVCKVARAGSAL
jgi:hypothetical protein